MAVTTGTQHAEHAHQFDSIDQQRNTMSLGMWLFIATEIMFFGGMFLAYTVYRSWYPAAWVEGSYHLLMPLGAVNTGLLLTSSFTVALAVRAVKIRSLNSLRWLLLFTVLLGIGFLAIKGYEYWDEYEKHHVPGANFELVEPQDPAVDPENVEIFFSLYFAMTGLHAAHMIIGLTIFSVMIAATFLSGLPEPMAIEVAGLYWHFVDIVWVFLFPILYLVA